MTLISLRVRSRRDLPFSEERSSDRERPELTFQDPRRKSKLGLDFAHSGEKGDDGGWEEKRRRRGR